MSSCFPRNKNCKLSGGRHLEKCYPRNNLKVSVDQLLTLPLIQCRQHTRYKTIVNIFLACLQVRLRLFLNHDLNYKSKKDSRSFKNNAKRNNYKSAPCLAPLLHGKKSDLQ